MQNVSFSKNFPYLYRGIVRDNIDPKNLGRCKIQIPSIHGGTELPSNYLPWARGVSNVVIGNNKGSSSIPDVGDIVWVLFEGGDEDYPVYLGGMQGVNDIPLKSTEVVLYQEGADRIYYDRESKIFTILSQGNLVSVGSHISILGNSVIINANSINLTGAVYINGRYLDLDALYRGVNYDG